MSAGTVIAGGVVSLTVTWNVRVIVSAGEAPLSVALQVTAVVPSANSDPLTGVHVAARFKSILTMRLTDCGSRSSFRPTTFWCLGGSASLVRE